MGPPVLTDVVYGVEACGVRRFLSCRADLPPLPAPEAAAFDVTACRARVAKLPHSAAVHGVDWSSAGIPPHMEPAEADFWLDAILSVAEGAGLAGVAPPDAAALDDRMTRLRTEPRCGLPPQAAGPLANRLGPVAFLKQLAAGEFGTSSTSRWTRELVEPNLVRGAYALVRPYLSNGELAELRDFVRPRLDPELWPKTPLEPNPVAFHVGALLGMTAEVRRLVRTWDYAPGDPRRDATVSYSPLLVLLGLDDPRWLLAQAESLVPHFAGAEDARAWLAATGVEGLAAGVARLRKDYYNAARLLEEFACVRDPAFAPLMLEWRLTHPAPAPARRWLERNAGSAVAGLLPTIAGKGKLAAAALDFLREVDSRGYRAVLAREAAGQPAALREKLRRHVLDRPRETPTAGAAPPAFAALARLEAKPLPDWLDAAVLPPLTAGGAALPPAAFQSLFGVLLTATEKGVPAGAQEACGALDADPADRFAVALFERWAAERPGGGDAWLLAALELLGGDRLADALLPRVSRWPGGGRRNRRALVRLLARVGTGYAVTRLAHLAAEHPTADVRDLAAAQLAKLAEARGVTPRALAEEALPDLGLAGGVDLDYGGRRFRVTLGADLRPAVRDAATRRVTRALPAPRQTDDAGRVAEARERFDALKGQLDGCVVAVRHRLERSLFEGQGWTPAGFRAAVLARPVAAAVAARLVWAAAAGGRVTCFRVTAEGELADDRDRPFELPESGRVALAHPADLSPDCRAAWRRRLDDYDLLPPFAQLTRPVFDLTPEELAATTYAGFAGGAVALTPAVDRDLTRRGWQRRGHELGRAFAEHGLRAAVEFFPGVPFKLGRVQFIPIASAPGPVDESAGVPLSAVPAALRCEVFADLAGISGPRPAASL